MNLGQKLLDLRKSKQLSQEEAAEKLNVTRQTISKWETDQSTPDFDKIIPICKLYGISTEELLTDNKKQISKATEVNKNKLASGIGLGIFFYFVSIVWIMISIPVIRMDPIVASAIFLLICGIATYIIVYSSITYRKEKNKKTTENKLRKQINSIVVMITLIIYLVVSFLTFAWHITWIIWVLYGLVCEIIKLIFMLRGNDNEE